MTPPPTRDPRDDAAQIDALCDRYEAGWLVGRPVPISDLVGEVPDSLRPELFRELLDIEQEYRRKTGTPHSPADVVRLYGGLGPWVAGLVREMSDETGDWATPDPDLPE